MHCTTDIHAQPISGPPIGPEGNVCSSDPQLVRATEILPSAQNLGKTMSMTEGKERQRIYRHTLDTTQWSTE